jgi:hypothetical protein
MTTLSKDQLKRSARYSQRFAEVLSQAIPSDYYSSDGQTWDPKADWNESPEFIKTSDEFKSALTVAVNAAVDEGSEEQDVLPELMDLAVRVETRNNDYLKPKPEGRQHRTKITYYSEDFINKPKETTIDLSTMEDSELEQLVLQIPEAVSELVYRELYGK